MKFPTLNADSLPPDEKAHPPSPELTDRVLRAAFDAIVLQSLRPVCIGLSALYVVFAISHALFLPPVAALPMTLVASATAFLLFGLYQVFRWRSIPASWAHPLGASIACLILFNSLLHLYLLSEPEQTTNVALLVIGVGCFFLSTRWLALLLAVSLGGWACVVLFENPSPAWRHFGFMLLAATVISVLIHTVRVRALGQLERMHLRDERRKTELEEAVRATQLSEERFRQLSEATFEGVAVHEQGRLADVNQTLAEMFGYSLAELIGTNALSLMAPESHAAVLNNLRSRDEKPFEAMGLKKGGATFPIEICGKTISHHGGTVSVMAIRDISERKRAEKERAQLIHEQAARAEAEAANRSKDEFLATISHELRTPLSSIRGWSQMLRSGEVDETLRERGLEIIERKAVIQAQLINDLLDVSRIITGKLRLDVRSVKMASLIAMAVDSVRPAADEKSIRLQTEIDEDAGTVLGDPERLQQVLWNLLSNAIKFTPPGGRVQIRLEQSDAHALVTVSDTGIGIAQEFLPHVFERFRQADSSSTRAYGGLGIGLSIVRHLVELHSGTVSAESKGEGQGATFTVRLPLVVEGLSELSLSGDWESAARPAGDAAGSQSNSKLEGLHVLVVDDDADTCEMLSLVLAKRGARVTTALSAREALEAMEREPDVLVSDIGMPHEDGYYLIGKVRTLGLERGRHIPAIALTAYAREEDRLHALSAGYQIHMPKPVEPEMLVAAIASLAGRTGQV